MKNNKIYLTLFFSFFSFLANNSFAGCDGFYIAGRGGITDYEIEDSRIDVENYITDFVVDKKRVIASGALGYRYKHFRAEAEFVWRQNNKVHFVDLAKTKFRSRSYMFVVYYDFFPNTWFTPFINAGIGYSENKIYVNMLETNTHYKLKDGNLTWSLGAGISAKLTNKMNMDIGYRYYDMGELSKKGGDSDMTSEEVYLGLRYIL